MPNKGAPHLPAYDDFASLMRALFKTDARAHQFEINAHDPSCEDYIADTIRTIITL